MLKEMRYFMFLFAAIALLVLAAPFVFAVPGDLDSTFGTNGVVETDLGGHDVSTDIALQSDGKIIVVGSDFMNAFDFVVIRYNSDGSLDASFGTNGKVTTDIGGIDYARGVAIQADGKIVVAGRSTVNGEPEFTLVRYNVNGSLDTTFDNDGIVLTRFSGVSSADDEAYAIALQADGKIIVSGKADSKFALARYNSNGSLDNTFDDDGRVIDVSGTANSVLVQSDGKIIAVGGGIKLIRYLADGSRDTTFGTGGEVVTTNFPLYMSGIDAALQADGKIVVVGNSYSQFSDITTYDIVILRYEIGGSIDTAFGTDGIVIQDFGMGGDQGIGVAIDRNGRILVSGTVHDVSAETFALIQFNTNGSLDTSFSGDGIADSVTCCRAHKAVIQPDSNIVVTGYTSGANFLTARFLGDLELNEKVYLPLIVSP
ncbi:MAG: hypothetical protein GY943_01480 [Chloroflexi bacterium]|nr:hypothetical protein [Chloroflexota bacterium]